MKDVPKDVRAAIFVLADAHAAGRTTANGAVNWEDLKGDVKGGLASGRAKDYPKAFANALGFGFDGTLDYVLGEWERATRRPKKGGLVQGELWAYMQPDGEWGRKWWPHLTYGDLELTVPHVRAEAAGHARKLARLDATIADFERYGLPKTATIEALEACKAAGPPPALTADDAINL